MPSGKVHLALEMTTLPGFVLAGAYLKASPEQLTVFALSYTAASLFLSPDLDLARSDPASRWGLLRYLWWPYAVVFHHRGLSHSLLLGPITRLLYLGLLVASVLLPLHFLAGVPLPSRFPVRFVYPTLAGVYLPHLLHVLADRLASRFSRTL